MLTDCSLLPRPSDSSVRTLGPLSRQEVRPLSRAEYAHALLTRHGQASDAVIPETGATTIMASLWAQGTFFVILGANETRLKYGRIAGYLANLTRL
jgi:hypothetical protein